MTDAMPSHFASGHPGIHRGDKAGELRCGGFGAMGCLGRPVFFNVRVDSPALVQKQRVRTLCPEVTGPSSWRVFTTRSDLPCCSPLSTVCQGFPSLQPDLAGHAPTAQSRRARRRHKITEIAGEAKKAASIRESGSFERSSKLAKATKKLEQNSRSC